MSWLSYWNKAADAAARKEWIRVHLKAHRLGRKRLDGSQELIAIPGCSCIGSHETLVYTREKELLRKAVAAYKEAKEKNA
jgi:hypothetical protein